jgi:hypothetical protein
MFIGKIEGKYKEKINIIHGPYTQQSSLEVFSSSLCQVYTPIHRYMHMIDDHVMEIVMLICDGGFWINS